MKLWNEKYKPKSLDEIPQPQATLVIKELLKSRKPMLLFGPTGSGKTILAHTLANDLDYELLEINASDLRDKEAITKIIGGSSQQNSLFGKNKIILIDEIDNITLKDKGCIQALLSMLPKAGHSIIFTAQNITNQKIKPLKQKCNSVCINKISKESIIKILIDICEKESIVYNKDSIEIIAEKSDGDLRAAINDLQAHSSSKKILDLDGLEERNNEKSVQHMLKTVFKTNNIIESSSAIDSTSLDLNESMLWIEENIPVEYKNMNDILKAYDSLSLADLFRARIRKKQYWRFLVYQKLFTGPGISLSKDNQYQNIKPYKRNSRPLKIWIHNQKYNLKKEIAKKLAKYTNTSLKKIMKDFQYYKKILRSNDFVYKKLDIKDEEIFFLSNTN